MKYHAQDENFIIYCCDQLASSHFYQFWYKSINLVLVTPHGEFCWSNYMEGLVSILCLWNSYRIHYETYCFNYVAKPATFTIIRRTDIYSEKWFFQSIHKFWPRKKLCNNVKQKFLFKEIFLISNKLRLSTNTKWRFYSSRNPGPNKTFSFS